MANRLWLSRPVFRAMAAVIGKRYPVPADLIGRHVWVGLLGNRMSIEHAGRIVATYTA